MVLVHGDGEGVGLVVVDHIVERVEVDVAVEVDIWSVEHTSSVNRLQPRAVKKEMKRSAESRAWNRSSNTPAQPPRFER